MKMKNGILRGDEGFDILINDMSRTFRDLEKVAYETARFMKQRRRRTWWRSASWQRANVA